VYPLDAVRLAWRECVVGGFAAVYWDEFGEVASAVVLAIQVAVEALLIKAAHGQAFLVWLVSWGMFGLKPHYADTMFKPCARNTGFAAKPLTCP